MLHRDAATAQSRLLHFVSDPERVSGLGVSAADLTSPEAPTLTLFAAALRSLSACDWLLWDFLLGCLSY